MARPPHHRIPWDPAGEAIPFVVGHDCLRELQRMLRSLAPDRIVVVTEAALARKLGLKLKEAMPGNIPLAIISIPAGEAAKSLTTLDTLARQALSVGVTRRSIVVSFGGGLVCNMAGMLAAMLFRGLRLVHVPTTLLAMHDTVTSLKQAVNVGGFKNLLGVYHRPAGVVCDVQFCASLSRDAVQAALIEIVKNGLVLGGQFLEKAKELCATDLKPTPEFCIEVIESGVAAKRSLMIGDGNERREAIVFEYGHTAGHALESTSSMSHGQAIYWGMRIAAEVALLTGDLTPRAYQQHREMLDLLGHVRPPAERIALTRLMDAAGHDNKRGHLAPKREHVQMVLLRGIASPVRTEGLPLTYVPTRKLAKALAALPFVSSEARATSRPSF